MNEAGIEAPPIPVGPFTLLDDDGETTLWECNDCGVLIPMYDDLCSRCCREEEERQAAERGWW